MRRNDVSEWSARQTTHTGRAGQASSRASRRRGRIRPPGQFGFNGVRARVEKRRGPDSGSLRSERADVLRLWALGTLRNVELDLLVLVKGTETARLDRRVMDEDVVPATLLGDKAKPLSPLNHLTVPWAMLLLLMCGRARARCGRPPVFCQCGCCPLNTKTPAAHKVRGR